MEPGDVILLYTGRWARRAALGSWSTTTGVAGYYVDVVPFLFERGVSFRAAGYPGRIPHDLRRSAIRTLVRAGLSEHTAMALSGHKTASIFRRYKSKAISIRLPKHCVVALVN